MRAVEVFIIILVIILAGIIAKPLVEVALKPQVLEVSCGNFTVSGITQISDSTKGMYIYEATVIRKDKSETKVYLSASMQKRLEKSGNKDNDCIVGSPNAVKGQPFFPVFSRDTPGPPFNKVGEISGE